MGSLLQTIVIFVLVLGGMIVIHEFGHFIVAKLFGVRVDVFSVGFGKRLWGVKKGDTDYRISLIPLGGYVKMAGENLDEKVTGAPDEFMSKPKWQRFCIAVAGPVMNILTALAIPAIIVMFYHEVPAYLDKPAVVKAVEPNSPAEKIGIRPGDQIINIDGRENPLWREAKLLIEVNPDQDIPLTIKRGDETMNLVLHTEGRPIRQGKIGYSGMEPEEMSLVVADVVAGEPAAQAGLQPGDQIIAINGKPVEQNEYGSDQVITAIRSSGNQPVTLTVKRGGQTLDIQATPQMKDGSLRLGFTQKIEGVEIINQRLGLFPAIKFSFDRNVEILDLTWTAIGQVFTGKRSARDTLSGPIGIAEVVGEASKSGAMMVFQLMGILSLNLGIFNLLPIPVLDGGLIFMLALEAFLGLFGLPLTMRIKERMMQVGFVMLMLLMGFVIFNDIAKMIPGRDTQPQQVEQPQQPPNK
ncbi:MAG TPA: RIP metalloprotease RseP [Blastocatellia bacterium]|nr:RIP metalloprotease RseP [Blastocatellia bacterium]